MHIVTPFRKESPFVIKTHIVLEVTQDQGGSTGFNYHIKLLLYAVVVMNISMLGYSRKKPVELRVWNFQGFLKIISSLFFIRLYLIMEPGSIVLKQYYIFTPRFCKARSQKAKQV